MTVKNFIGANAVLYFYIALGGAQAATASDASGPKLPQLDIETYASQIFWLIVTFIVLYFLVAKIAMPRIAEVLEGRQERIEDDLDKAETLKKEAYLVKVEYEKALSSAREEAHDATRRAQDEIAKHSAEVEALANQKVANMLKDAEDRIDAARTVHAVLRCADLTAPKVARDDVRLRLDKQRARIEALRAAEIHAQISRLLGILDVDLKQRLYVVGRKRDGYGKHVLVALRGQSLDDIASLGSHPGQWPDLALPSHDVAVRAKPFLLEALHAGAGRRRNFGHVLVAAVYHFHRK